MELEKYNIHWDLFYKTYPKECREANQEINSHLLFNLGGIFATNLMEPGNGDALKKSVEEALKNMNTVLEKYSKLGALDSEPRQQLSEVINTFFKDFDIRKASVNQYGDVFVSGNTLKM